MQPSGPSLIYNILYGTRLLFLGDAVLIPEALSIIPHSILSSLFRTFLSENLRHCFLLLEVQSHACRLSFSFSGQFRQRQYSSFNFRRLGGFFPKPSRAKILFPSVQHLAGFLLAHCSQRLRIFNSAFIPYLALAFLND